MKRKIAISIICIFVGLMLNLVIHECSHLLFLKIFDGDFENISIGTTSFVTGYIEPKHITIVALSSIFVPLTISCILAFVKQLYVEIFCCSFTISTFMNSFLGLIVNFFEKEMATRQTFDVLLAADNANYPIIVYMVTFVFMLLSSFIIGLSMKRIVENFS